MITPISDGGALALAGPLTAALRAAGREAQCIDASVLRVLPCTACGSCSGKTFGRCVLNDDMADLLSRIASSQALVWLSSLRFGSVSSLVKTLMDRMCTQGDVHYRVRGGELLKGMMLPQDFRVHLLATTKAADAAGEQALRQLHAEQLRIMDRQGQCLVLPEDADITVIEKAAEVIAHG